MRRALLLLIVLVAPGVAHAHGMRTAYFELTETAPGVGSAALRFTLNDPEVALTIEGCALSPTGGDAAANRSTYVFACPSPLAGRTVRAFGLGPLVTETVVRAALVDGSVRSGVLRADQPTLVLRERDSALRVSRTYVRLGVVHIATGLDHLLFLLALALQLWSVRSVLVAESAFTVSHTLSFSATALGLVHLSPLAAEACIALSLLLLARELVAGRRITARRGAVVALLFDWCTASALPAASPVIGLLRSTSASRCSDSAPVWSWGRCYF